MSNLVAESYYNKVVGKPEPTRKAMRDKYDDSHYSFPEEEKKYLMPLQKRVSRLKKFVKWTMHKTDFDPTFMLTGTQNKDNSMSREELAIHVGKFFNNLNSQAKQDLLPSGKMFNGVEKGEKNGLPHSHSVINHKLLVLKELLDKWIGNINFRNVYSKKELLNILAEKFRVSSKVLDIYSPNLMNRKGMLKYVTKGKGFRSFLNLNNNDCKTKKEMRKLLDSFIIYLKKKYGKNIRYYIRIFWSKQYECYTSFMLTNLVVEEAWRLCKAWKIGWLDISPIRDKNDAINYSVGYALKEMNKVVKQTKQVELEEYIKIKEEIKAKQPRGIAKLMIVALQQTNERVFQEIAEGMTLFQEVSKDISQEIAEGITKRIMRDMYIDIYDDISDYTFKGMRRRLYEKKREKEREADFNKYGKGYSYSRGLPKPPRGWRYNEEVATGLTNSQAKLVVETKGEVLKHIEVHKELKSEVVKKRMDKISFKLRIKEACEDMNHIRFLNTINVNHKFVFGIWGNYDPTLSDPFSVFYNTRIEVDQINDEVLKMKQRKDFYKEQEQQKESSINIMTDWNLRRLKLELYRKNNPTIDFRGIDRRIKEIIMG